MKSRDAIAKKRSTYLHKEALRISEKESISYKDALFQASQYVENNPDEFNRFMDQATSEEGTKKACKGTDRGEGVDLFSLRLDRAARKFAEEKGIPYKDALMQVARSPSFAIFFDERPVSPEVIQEYYKKLKKIVDQLSEEAKRTVPGKKLTLGQAFKKLDEDLWGALDKLRLLLDEESV